LFDEAVSKTRMARTTPDDGGELFRCHSVIQPLKKLIRIEQSALLWAVGSIPAAMLCPALFDLKGFSWKWWAV